MALKKSGQLTRTSLAVRRTRPGYATSPCTGEVYLFFYLPLDREINSCERKLAELVNSWGGNYRAKASVLAGSQSQQRVNDLDRPPKYVLLSLAGSQKQSTRNNNSQEDQAVKQRRVLLCSRLNLIARHIYNLLGADR